MNAGGLNSSTLNGAVVQNQVIDLGSVAASIAFTTFERSLIKLSGSTGIGFNAYGDITKMAQIGAANAGIVFTTYAQVTTFTYQPIGVVSTGINFSVSASLYNKKTIGISTASINLNATANVSNNKYLSSLAEINFSASSNGPQIYRQLGQAKSGISLDVQSELNNYVAIPSANTGIGFLASASISNFSYMRGDVSIQFLISGNIFNNPNSYDPAENVFSRPYEDRVMTR